MSLENISNETAQKILKELKVKNIIYKKSPKKSPTFVSFNISGKWQHPMTTTSPEEILKFIFAEVLHDIDKRSPASIKGMIAEAGEWIAQAEITPAKQRKIREIMANLMHIKTHKHLILAVGRFAVSMKGNYI